MRPLLIDEIKANQDKDPSFIKLRETVQSGQTSGFEIRIYKKPIMHLIVFIQESPRCTKMLKVCIGGMG